MPELPEVETVKNGLIKKVKGRKIIGCQVLYKGIIAYPETEKFIERITNQTIKDIKRRGKFIIFELVDMIANLPSYLSRSSNNFSFFFIFKFKIIGTFLVISNTSSKRGI